MPTISWFYGVAIRMYFDDHAPPHFHAVHGRDVALIEIATGEVLEGALRTRERRLVKLWTLKHRERLLTNWAIAQSGAITPLTRIPGLDEADG